MYLQEEKTVAHFFAAKTQGKITRVSAVPSSFKVIKIPEELHINDTYGWGGVEAGGFDASMCQTGQLPGFADLTAATSAFREHENGVIAILLRTWAKLETGKIANIRTAGFLCEVAPQAAIVGGTLNASPVLSSFAEMQRDKKKFTDYFDLFNTCDATADASSKRKLCTKKMKSPAKKGNQEANTLDT